MFTMTSTSTSAFSAINDDSGEDDNGRINYPILNIGMHMITCYMINAVFKLSCLMFSTSISVSIVLVLILECN